MPGGITTPRHCPACNTELYPIARLRPRAGLSVPAKVLLGFGVAASSAVFVGAMIWFTVDPLTFSKGGRVRVGPGGGIVGMIAIVPALIPGLIMAWIAHRLPKTLKLRCSKCSWHERYEITSAGHLAHRHGFPVAPEPPDASEIEAKARFDAIGWQLPPLAPPPTGPATDMLAVNDVCAWIDAALASGRRGEEITAILISHHWQADEAEQLVYQRLKRSRQN